MVNEKMKWEMETADLDYQYEQYEMQHFLIDRSDSMMGDDVRIASYPKVTTHRGHRIHVEPWVETYDKFINELFK